MVFVRQRTFTQTQLLSVFEIDVFYVCLNFDFNVFAVHEMPADKGFDTKKFLIDLASGGTAAAVSKVSRVSTSTS
jgi:hypothetical protein